MKKATLIEASTIVASGAVAGSLGAQLADHNVSIAATVAAITAVLSTGLYLAQQIGQGFRTTLYTCPAKGCTAFIRVKNTSPEELARLRALAADHSKHGGA